jgi:hypothetical protein
VSHTMDAMLCQSRDEVRHAGPRVIWGDVQEVSPWESEGRGKAGREDLL